MAIFQPRFRDETVDRFLGYAPQPQQAMMNQTLTPTNWSAYWGQHAANTSNQHPTQGPSGNYSQGLSYGNQVNPSGSFWKRPQSPSPSGWGSPLGMSPPSPYPQQQAYGRSYQLF